MCLDRSSAKKLYFYIFRLPQETDALIWDEMGQEMGAGRDAHVSALLRAAVATTCTRLGDLSPARDELHPEEEGGGREEGGKGGRRPTAAVQTFFEKHHTAQAPPPPHTSPSACTCCRRCAAPAVNAGLTHPGAIHMQPTRRTTGWAA